MHRTLTLKLFVHQENGLSLTVKKTTVTGDDGEKETITTEKTDAWPPSSICSAVEEIITDYLATIGEDDREESPIEKAARG